VAGAENCAQRSGDSAGNVNVTELLASFALQFANVKIILYGITALSAFVLPYTHNIAVVAVMSVSLPLSARREIFAGR
jgi:threonine/homoserine/homoserine lactone efflux protein